MDPDYTDSLDCDYGCTCRACENSQDEHKDCHLCETRVHPDDFDTETDRCNNCRQKITCPNCDYPQDGGMCQDCRCEIVDLELCEGAD